MAIVAGDILYRLSGGASNAVQAASLGGAKSTTTVATSGIFDDVSAAESTAGDVEYRCVYIHNAHATLTLSNAVAWYGSNTPSASTDVTVGLGTSAVNVAEQSVANENTAPTGVTFVAAASKAGGVALGNLAPGDSIAIWLKRTVTAGAAVASDGFTVRVEGDTPP